MSLRCEPWLGFAVRLGSWCVDWEAVVANWYLFLLVLLRNNFRRIH